MAIDTQAKRMSVIGISLYATCPSVLPDGSFDQADRQTIGYGYSGNLVGGIPDVIFANRHSIERGIVADTAAQMGGVIIENL